MTTGSSVAVWSPWALHADALAVGLVEAGGQAVVVDDPGAAPGVLVATVVAPDLVDVLAHRHRAGRATVVWGGTLGASRVTDLLEDGAAAYVSELARPGELADVVLRVQGGEDMGRPQRTGPSVALTRREREMAEAYLVTGAHRTRAQVAQDLGISERTLKVHVANIRGKTGHEGTATREGLRHELVARGWLA